MGEPEDGGNHFPQGGVICLTAARCLNAEAGLNVYLASQDLTTG